jgi:hypothetical protein
MSVFDSGVDSLDSFIENKSTVIITSTTYDFIEMLLNWYESLRRVNLHEIAFVIALDTKSYDTLQSRNIPCALIDARVENNTAAQWIENAKRFKPRGVLHLYKNYPVNLIHLDTDIVFFKNFIPRLEQDVVGYDMIMASDRRFDIFTHKRIKDRIITVDHGKTTVSDWGLAEQAKFGKKNGAIMYLPQSTRDKNLIYLEKNTSEEMYKKFPIGVQEGSLQTISNSKALIEETGININILSVYDFPNGSLWKIPYLREQIKDTCYLVHYNFHSHADPKNRVKEKIEAMKLFGHWYL